MTKETSPILRLRDWIAALEKRELHDEVEYYSTIYPFFLSLAYDVPQEEIMDMTIDDLAKLSSMPQKPLKYDGWNTFYFGRAAFGNNS
ncbi:unnamed protein product [marine sediment metagenome]|uniref:Uncharacterized protein n=1 Tax=marine sediment metagenome TaxID=412755 RepID=X1T5N6_9ZZZZ